MKQRELLLIVLLGYLMLTAGLVWKFGEYGLIGAGAGLAIAPFLTNVKE